MRRKAVDDSVDPIHGRTEELLDGAFEFRVAVVFFEVRQQKLEPKPHVLDVVDEDAIEGRADFPGTSGGLFAHTLTICPRC